MEPWLRADHPGQTLAACQINAGICLARGLSHVLTGICLARGPSPGLSPVLTGS